MCTLGEPLAGDPPIQTRDWFTLIPLDALLGWFICCSSTLSMHARAWVQVTEAPITRVGQQALLVHWRVRAWAFAKARIGHAACCYYCKSIVKPKLHICITPACPTVLVCCCSRGYTQGHTNACSCRVMPLPARNAFTS